MLNLLFISDNPKAEYIKSVLQSVLKVKIDVATDFDNGFKNVFEKRPFTVCIQEQIGGIEAESVARHIQMMLGNVAPTFILLHEGGNNTRMIKGLFEHLIDISQPNETLAENIKSTLELLCGKKWEKIYIQPKLTTNSAKSSAVAQEELHVAPDSHLDDSISDLEKIYFSFDGCQSSPSTANSDMAKKKSLKTRQSETSGNPENVFGTVELDRAQSINDDLTEIILMDESKRHLDENEAATSSPVDHESIVVPIDSPKTTKKPMRHPSSMVPEPLEQIEAFSGRPPLKESTISTFGKNEIQRTTFPVTQPQVSQAPIAAAFCVKPQTLIDEEHLVKDIRLAFKKSSRLNSLYLKRIFVVVSICVLCAIGGWYIVTQYPLVISSIKQQVRPSLVVKQELVAVQIPHQPAIPSIILPVVIPLLPKFIPKDGHDSSYALKNPGWERYIGTSAEFRVLIAAGRIRAVQIIATKDMHLSESLIKSILKELTGSSEYQIISRSIKAGLHVENGKIQNKDEVMIYRKSGSVKAVVVSVN